jgi:hypothetical protein
MNKEKEKSEIGNRIKKERKNKIEKIILERKYK